MPDPFRGDAGWTKPVAPPRDEDRPTGLPSAAGSLAAEKREHAQTRIGLGMCLEEIDELRAENKTLRDALDFITGGIDREPWVSIYRSASGGYGGLQAVAQSVLDRLAHD